MESRHQAALDSKHTNGGRLKTSSVWTRRINTLHSPNGTVGPQSVPPSQHPRHHHQAARGRSHPSFPLAPPVDTCSLPPRACTTQTTHTHTHTHTLSLSPTRARTHRSQGCAEATWNWSSPRPTACTSFKTSGTAAHHRQDTSGLARVDSKGHRHPKT